MCSMWVDSKSRVVYQGCLLRMLRARQESIHPSINRNTAKEANSARGETHKRETDKNVKTDNIQDLLVYGSVLLRV